MDDLTRLIVFHDANHQCQARDVGMVKCGGPLQWAHVITRSSKSIRWLPLNAMCMCAGHHAFFWHKEPVAAANWFNERWPGRYGILQYHRQHHQKLDMKAQMLWLEQECAKRGIAT